MNARRAAAVTLLAAAALAACSSRAPAPAPSPAAIARPIDPVESRTGWSFAGRHGEAIRTANYRIWTTELDPVINRRLPIFLEEAIAHYRTALGGAALPPPEDRLDTFILANRHQWELLTRQLMGEGADLYLRIPRGGFAWGGRSVLYDIGAQGTMAIAAHEGWHQYTQRTFKEGLPIWLEEGIAAFMEGHRWGGPPASDSASAASGARPVFLGWANPERYDQLRADAAAGNLMTLREILETTPQGMLEGGSAGALTYYAQVWALVHFLREGAGGAYRPALERVVADAAAGRLHRTLATALEPDAARAAVRTRRGTGVFEAYFTADLARAEREYASFIQRIVRPGGRTAIAEGRSPIAP